MGLHSTPPFIDLMRPHLEKFGIEPLAGRLIRPGKESPEPRKDAINQKHIQAFTYFINAIKRGKPVFSTLNQSWLASLTIRLHSAFWPNVWMQSGNKSPSSMTETQRDEMAAEIHLILEGKTAKLTYFVRMSELADPSMAAPRSNLSFIDVSD